jgi:death-on-curing protein
MNVKYLSLEEILRLHFQVIDDFGGGHGIRDEGRLKSAVEASRQVVFDNELYPSITEKAAVYLRNIIGDHPFTDGNKRTALTVCGVFLMRNGHSIQAPNDELELFVIKVAINHLNIEDISTWLIEHLT